jgi:hypothetical protein
VKSAAAVRTPPVNPGNASRLNRSLWSGLKNRTVAGAPAPAPTPNSRYPTSKGEGGGGGGGVVGLITSETAGELLPV